MGDFKNYGELFTYLTKGGHIRNIEHSDLSDVYLQDGEICNGQTETQFIGFHYLEDWIKRPSVTTIKVKGWVVVNKYGEVVVVEKHKAQADHYKASGAGRVYPFETIVEIENGFIL